MESLWGGESEEANVAAGWHDFIAASKLRNVMSLVEREYYSVVRDLAPIVASTPELYRRIEEQYNMALLLARHQAHEQALRDDFDVSTDEKFEAYLKDWDWPTPIMRAARDIFAALEADNGEGD